MVVVQILIRRIQSVDSPRSLPHNLIGVVLAVEYNGVRLDAVPAFSTGIVLHQIDPPIAFRKRLMLVPVPLCNFSVLAIVQTHQNIKLIVEIIEDDDPGPAFANIKHFFLSACISVHQLPQQIAELAGGLDWLVLPEIPPVLADRQILHLVVIHKYILMVRNSRPLEVHVNQNPFPQPYQALGIQIPIDLRVLRTELAVYHVLVVKVRSVSVEPIGDEHRDIIRPAVPGVALSRIHSFFA